MADLAIYRNPTANPPVQSASVSQQLNIDALQDPRYNFRFASTNIINGTGPLQQYSDPYKHGGTHEASFFSMTPGSKNNLAFMPLPSSNQESDVVPNQQPRKMLNYAQPMTFGAARGQNSLISDPQMNPVGRTLVMTNKPSFELEAYENRILGTGVGGKKI